MKKKLRMVTKLTNDIDLYVLTLVALGPELENGQFSGVEVTYSFTFKLAFVSRASIKRKFRTNGTLVGGRFSRILQKKTAN